MPKFGTRSSDQLETCHVDIQTIFKEVVKYFDCSVIEGRRTAERQHEHWRKGRELISSEADPKKRASWVKVGNVVTGKDGYEKLSKHQSGIGLSIAVDVVPYPSMWSDMVEFHKLAGVVYYIQDKLFDEGRIQIKLDRGYDIWNGFDAPHWQIREEYL